MKKSIIAIIAVLVVLGGTFAGLWFFTDVFNFLKPANEVFSSQLEKALDVEGVKFENYSNFLKDYEEIAKKSSKAKLNITANFNITDLDEEVQDIINNSKLTFESSADVEKNKTQNKIGLETKNKEVLTLDLVTNDTTIGVGCEDLYDKYLTITLEDLIELMAEEADMSSAELEALTSSLSGAEIDPYKLLYISEDDLKHFDETYRNCLTTLISKDCYTTEKNVEVEVDGEDVKAKAYYLTLTGEDAYNFINELGKLLKDDEVMPRIVAEKINLVLEGMDEEKISEKDVEALIDELVDALIAEIEPIKDEKDSAIQLAIYSKGNNPVRIDFNTIADVEEMDEKDTLISIEYAENKEIYTLYEDGKALGSLTNKIEKDEDDEKVGELSLTVSGVSLGTLKYEMIDKKDESKLALDLDVPLAEVSGKIEISTKGDYTKEPMSMNALVEFKVAEESFKINIDGSIEFGDVSIPDLTDKNSVEILELSDKELEDTLLEILENASEVLPERLELLGIDIDADDILPTTNTKIENDVVTEVEKDEKDDKAEKEETTTEKDEDSKTTVEETKKDNAEKAN